MSSPAVEETTGGSETASAEIVSDPSDAFQALGNETRMGILETMLERADETETGVTFSELFEASAADTSAGFAYHLEQLVGPYLEKDGDEHYELTYAGRKIARAIATGAYTRRVDHPPVSLAESCPFCSEQSLTAQSTDNIVAVACENCGRSLLRLGFPPSGLESHGEGFPEAFDRHHRHRLGLMAEGVCPECSGEISSELVRTASSTDDALPPGFEEHVQAAFNCDLCGLDVRCPVSLAFLDRPVVVSLYHDHGRNIRDRPIWNVGHEWTETILSEEPLAVRVVVELEGDVLALYVDEGLEVVDVQRSETNAAASEGTTDAAA
ncbi:ArsR family transcriptional regulator [Halostagnicola sp. A56]|nr:ArsR family transcriptional regulator [Halostagnicola sp. A56]